MTEREATRREKILQPGESVTITLPGEEWIITVAEVKTQKPAKLPEKSRLLVDSNLRDSINDFFLKYAFEVINLEGSETDRDAFFNKAAKRIIEISTTLNDLGVLFPKEDSDLDLAQAYFEVRAKTMLWKTTPELAAAHGRSVLDYFRENFHLTGTENKSS